MFLIRIERYLISAECCKEFLGRIARYLIELGAANSLLGELQVILLSRVLGVS